MTKLALVALVLRVPLAAAPADATDYFAIEVVDEITGRGVPLVELKTRDKTAWWTDSHGLVAFNEPGLMGHEVFFEIASHGYEYPKDFFGFRGIKLKPVPGGNATIKLKRLNIAERLYRQTGRGIYRDTVLLGRAAPIAQPLLNAQVMGQDTVIATPYRGKIYWFWGDTERAAYGLGNYGASGATSQLPGRGGLDPDVGVNFTYFTNSEGFSKPMCDVEGSGLRWIEGVFTLRDDDGRERLVARMANHQDLYHTHDWHLLLFDDEKEVFKSVQRWAIHDPHDSAHPVRLQENGKEYYYIYPNWRVPADLKSFADLSAYEALTCMTGTGDVSRATASIDRDSAGQVRYSWKAGAPRLHQGRMDKLIESGALTRDDDWMLLRDVGTGARVRYHRGSVYWNEYRRRWVMIFSGAPGTIWFSEADTITGPWVYARQVVSHDNYNFYNPTQHPFFDQDGGKLIYFEGTYTAAFSSARTETPRYDYNQIMYRLDLSDERLTLPAPVYVQRRGSGYRYVMGNVTAEPSEAGADPAPFFGVPTNRPGAGLIAVWSVTVEGKSMLWAGEKPEGTNGAMVCYALPAMPEPAKEGASGRHATNRAVVNLFEYVSAEGVRSYWPEDHKAAQGQRAAAPLCRVWANPRQ